MGFDSFVRRTHRVVAALFLLTIPPAAYFSITGDASAPSPFVYAPLFPLLVLTLTGAFQLVKPWLARSRTR